MARDPWYGHRLLATVWMIMVYELYLHPPSTIQLKFPLEGETPSNCFTKVKTAMPCGRPRTKEIQAISPRAIMASNPCLVSEDLQAPQVDLLAPWTKGLKEECLLRWRWISLCSVLGGCRKVSTSDSQRMRERMNSTSCRPHRWHGGNKHWCRKRKTHWMKFMKTCTEIRGNKSQQESLLQLVMSINVTLKDTLILDKKEIQTISKFK